MRYVLIVCFMTCSLAARAATGIAACARIDNPAHRLHCYDVFARHRSPAASVTSASGKKVAAPESGTETTVVSIPEHPVTSSKQRYYPDFGERDANVLPGDSISANLVSAHRDNLRLYEMTLDNGEVWIQREPGDRPITAGQPVTITRKRWSYSMLLEDQSFEVTVERMK